MSRGIRPDTIAASSTPGIYYAPGSFRAELCRKGAAETVAFCQAHAIPYEVCGKLLVATNAAELARMDALFQRARDNKVDAERLDAAELRRREPNISGLGALFVPSTGIVDYAQISEAMARDLRTAGGQIELSAEVTGIAETVEYVTVTAGRTRVEGAPSHRMRRASGGPAGPAGGRADRVPDRAVSR